MKQEATEVFWNVLTFLQGLVPGAIGAAVATAFDKSATFGHRVVQFVVGILVSYYVGSAIHEYFQTSGMIQQSISFTLGMVAYQSVPSFTKATAETAGSIPKDLWSWVKGKLGIKS